MAIDDYRLTVEDGPKGASIFLGDLERFFRDELRASGGDLVLPRFLAKLFAVAFAEASARVDGFETGDRSMRRELEIAHAEIAQLRQKLWLLDPPSAPPPPAEERGRVVDLATIVRRMRAEERGS